VRNAATTTSSVVTYDVVLDVANPGGLLRPGMTANVLILIMQKARVAAVPNEALRFRPAASRAGPMAARGAPPEARGGAAVYVARGPDAVRLVVSTGVTDGSLTEVVGLEPGREVIIDVARAGGRAPAARAGGERGL
jgi:HlyD family secretion protein